MYMIRYKNTANLCKILASLYENIDKYCSLQHKHVFNLQVSTWARIKCFIFKPFKFYTPILERMQFFSRAYLVLTIVASTYQDDPGFPLNDYNFIDYHTQQLPSSGKCFFFTWQCGSLPRFLNM